MTSASTQTYMTWRLSKGTGTPHLNVERVTHRSSHPGSRKLLSISFALETGCMKSGFSLMYSISLGAYFDTRRKYASSLASSVFRPQSGQTPPASLSWVSVQNASHWVQ